jgi:transposase
MTDRLTIQNLKAKDPEISNREIARRLNISHHTVEAALKTGVDVKYSRKEKPNPALENFRDVVTEMALKKKLTGARILTEIQSKGYSGGVTAFYSFLSKIKQPETKYFTPYETAPCEQAQFDWSPYTVMIGGKLTRIYLYCFINSFSRYQILEVSTSQNQGAVLEALENSIIESGGSPERVQTDNAKAFVINASVNNFEWNQRYINFCSHYHFNPSRSLPGHPWSKGKVERGFQYIENHFISGNQFEDYIDLYSKLKDFQNTCNNRIHSTTKAAPTDLFEKEKSGLFPLPETRYVGTTEEIRKVNYDCLLSHGGSRYSVPWMFAGKQVWIRVSRGCQLHIYSQNNKLIAAHDLSKEKGGVVINPEHYRNKRLNDSSLSRLQSMFLEEFPGQEMFIEKLKAQKRINARNQLIRIMELVKLYERDDFLNAIAKSLEYEVFNHSFISGYLEKNFTRSFVADSSGRKVELPKGNVKRDLSQYDIFN